MSIPPIPPPLEHLGARPFSFYPAILNIEHNEWLYRKATWSEILVYNVKSHQELWIPRRFLGELSRIDEPVVIVGLIKELELRGGAILPHQRRVIEMPVAVGDRSRPISGKPEPAPVVGIRLEPGAETRIGKLILGALMVGVLGTVGVVVVTREGTLRQRTVYTNTDTQFQELTVRDDYYSIVNKLGKPADDRSLTTGGDLEFRSLWYPQRAYYVILMGVERNNLQYIGAMDKDWNVIHSVMKGNVSTASMLRGLKRF
ncbi:MAG TPA: hypothetical protein VL285_12210 [Bryobacteraceae bacterium]|jgi:hypothetical protein|nr:hypothetical protein [Bryobacteraceae bacterium]